MFIEESLIKDQPYVLNAKNVGLHNHWFNIEELDDFYNSDSSSQDEGTNDKTLESRTFLLSRSF